MSKGSDLDGIEQGLRSFGNACVTIYRRLRYGFRALKTRRNRIALAIAAVLATINFFLQPLYQRLPVQELLQKCIWLLVLLLPLWFLLAFGSKESRRQMEYSRAFAEIGFQGRDKRYPFLVYAEQEGAKETLCFQSVVSLKTWEAKKEELETALDKKILDIRPLPASKRRVELVTVDAAHTLPTMLPWKEEYHSQEEGEIIIGETELGPVSFNIGDFPHVLSAGETGSGKSVILRLILWQMINQGAVAYIIDFKGGVEFGLSYERYAEVIIEREKALACLQMLDEENKMRQALFRKSQVKNLKQYNQVTGQNLSRIVVLVDEMAELLDKTGLRGEEKQLFLELEAHFRSIARVGRSSGIHLLMGLQRPDAQVLSGQIKNNVPVRICGRFVDKVPSQIVLGNGRAAELPPIKGRFLFNLDSNLMAFQAYFFDDSILEFAPEVNRSQRRVLVKEAPAPKATAAAGRASSYEPIMDDGPEDTTDPWQEQAAADQSHTVPQPVDLDLNFDL